MSEEQPSSNLLLIKVEPQPNYIESSGRWQWPLKPPHDNDGRCPFVVTASREWWEYAPSEAKPHPFAEGVMLRDEVWYWAVPESRAPVPPDAGLRIARQIIEDQDTYPAHGATGAGLCIADPQRELLDAYRDRLLDLIDARLAVTKDAVETESHSGRSWPGETSACSPADDRGMVAARSSAHGIGGKSVPVESIPSREPVDCNTVPVERASPEQIHAKDVDPAPSITTDETSAVIKAACPPCVWRDGCRNPEVCAIKGHCDAPPYSAPFTTDVP